VNSYFIVAGGAIFCGLGLLHADDPEVQKVIIDRRAFNARWHEHVGRLGWILN
jgi:hypothetical protein